MSDQTAKADAGKLRLTLAPPEILEAVAAVRHFGVEKYADVDNWKRVEKDRYKDALFRHYVAYLREPYGVDGESGLPHLYHVACNLDFLLSLEMESGTIPRPVDALKKMRHPDGAGGDLRRSDSVGGYIFADDLRKPQKGAEATDEEWAEAIKYKLWTYDVGKGTK